MMSIVRQFLRLAAAAATLMCLSPAQAGLGFSQIPPRGTDGPVTVYYPTSAIERPVKLGFVMLSAAVDARPERGNGRLVMISHGSGGAPWVHADLARRLVEAGFIVAMPEHHADNYRDDSDPGPDSWSLRPAEVSRAIDAVAQDTRFASLLRLDRVGMYGMSAGGHTALSLAGGRWSPAGFASHCEAHLVEDFQSCVGLITRLTGGPLDGLKKWGALAVIRHRFSDPRPREHVDPRIAAIVAGVPTAADFDMASLAHPRVALALITAGQDRWLTPRFHSDRVLAACKTCEHLAHFESGGHGALLSPLPPHLGGLLGDMLNDPPGFDRAGLTPAVDAKVVGFFQRHLLPLETAPVPPA